MKVITSISIFSSLLFFVIIGAFIVVFAVFIDFLLVVVILIDLASGIVVGIDGFSVMVVYIFVLISVDLVIFVVHCTVESVLFREASRATALRCGNWILFHLTTQPRSWPFSWFEIGGGNLAQVKARLFHENSLPTWFNLMNFCRLGPFSLKSFQMTFIVTQFSAYFGSSFFKTM